MINGKLAILISFIIITFIIIMRLIYKSLKKKLQTINKEEIKKKEKIRDKILSKIKSGDINIIDNEGRSLLMHSIHENIEDLAIEIIQLSKNVNFQTPQKITALHYACQIGMANAVQSLINRGADVNIVDNKKLSPIWIASKEGYYLIVELLIKAGANVNIQEDNWGLSPLMVAAKNGRNKIVDLLLENKADLTLKTPEGDDVVKIAQDFMGRNMSAFSEYNYIIQDMVMKLEAAKAGKTFRKTRHKVVDDYEVDITGED